jgi:hypothetical protein
MIKKLILATCKERPDGSPDDAYLRAALAAANVDFETRVWTDHTVDWTSVDPVIVRTTWDYHRNLAAFVD